MKKALIALCAMMAVAASAFANGAKESAPSAAVEKSAAAGPTKLTYWAPLNPAIAAIANDFGGTAYWQELMKRTNTDISFQHAPAKTMADAFNVMIASGDYPDIIEYKWIAYPGGPQVAIDDGVIIPLNDVFKKYCPNITKFLDEHPDVAKMISTNDGTYYAFPYLRGEDYVNNPLLFSEGWVWRKDLLAKAGINEIPETPDEIYTALKAFQSMGVQIPVCIRPDHINRVFGPGFDSWDDFYVEDGKEPQWRRFSC